MIDLQKYQVRQGTEKDAEAILGLINRIQPNDAWSLQHFNWQYQKVADANTLLYLIYYNENLVSLYVAVPKNIRFNNTVREAYMVQDVMTDPEHRGQGFLHYLSSLCTKAIIDKGALAYTFPNKLSENSFRRNGWSELSKVPLRVKTISTKKTEIFPLMEQVLAFDDRATTIWQQSGLQTAVHRDANFLNWRYARPETNYYRFYYANDTAFFVLKVFRNAEKTVLHLLDLVIKEESRNALSDILAFVENLAMQQGAILITS